MEHRSDGNEHHRERGLPCEIFGYYPHVTEGCPCTNDNHVMGPYGGYRQDMINKQNLVLKTYVWPAGQSGEPQELKEREDKLQGKATLLFVHGHGSHCMFDLLKIVNPGQHPGYKDSWVQRMNEAGLDVCGIDLQGCGLSESLHGKRFYVEKFNDYVVDVIQFAENMNAKISNGEKPRIFVSGLSLGGCIAYCAAQQRPDIFAGLVMMAPMLSLERVTNTGMNKFLRPVASLLSIFAPTALIVASEKNTMYPEIQNLWDMDPLVCTAPRVRIRNAFEYIRATEAITNSLGEHFDVPFIVFHSENDTMTDSDGSKRLFLKSRTEDKTLRLVNSFWHVIIKEPGNEKICHEIIKWIIDRS